MDRSSGNLPGDVLLYYDLPFCMIQRLDMPRQTIEPSLVDGYDIPVLLVSQYQIFLFLHSISKITVERQSSYSAGFAFLPHSTEHYVSL